MLFQFLEALHFILASCLTFIVLEYMFSFRLHFNLQVGIFIEKGMCGLWNFNHAHGTKGPL